MKFLHISTSLMGHLKAQLAVAAALTVMGASCEQIIEIDLPEQPSRLVVNSAFTPDSTWKARVTFSTDIQDANGPQPVQNAVVLIQENGATLDTLRHAYEDVYHSVLGTTPQAGHTYTLTASAPGFENVSGSDHVPHPVAPVAITWRDSVLYDPFNGYSGEVSFQIHDPAGEENFYVLNVYGIDTVYELSDTLLYFNPLFLAFQDPIMEWDAYLGSVLFHDATFDGATRTLKVQLASDEYSWYAGRLVLGLSSASAAYYRYTQTLSSYFETGFNPFAEPVRVHSNMTAGMGIFAGYSVALAPVP